MDFPKKPYYFEACFDLDIATGDFSAHYAIPKDFDFSPVWFEPINANNFCTVAKVKGGKNSYFKFTLK